MQTPLSDKGETPVGGVELVLISPGGYSYRTTSLDSKGRDEGFYAFRRIPAGVHSLAYRRPGSARWWQEPVEVDYTVTAGTQLDLLLPDTTARTRRR
jgi:hypothetical protein